jgi:Metal binding domain of Ada
MLEKLKSFLTDDALFQAILLVMVAITSFGLGRQSVLEGDVKSVGISPVSSSVEVPETSTLAPVPMIATSSSEQKVVAGVIDGVVVASKSGSKYHLPTCAGAKTIKPENLISFTSREEAEAAGYAPAANCPGLQ